MTLAFTVTPLPRRNLSSNAGTRSRRNPWDVAESRGILKGDTMDAIKSVPRQTFERCRATVTLLHTGKRPSMDACPRCRSLGAEYPSWALPAHGKPLTCIEYRPRDVGNVGGDVLKPILDALVWEAVIEDDDYTRLVEVTLRIARVESLDDECVFVEVDAA